MGGGSRGIIVWSFRLANSTHAYQDSISKWYLVDYNYGSVIAA